MQRKLLRDEMEDPRGGLGGNGDDRGCGECIECVKCVLPVIKECVLCCGMGMG